MHIETLPLEFDAFSAAGWLAWHTGQPLSTSWTKLYVARATLDSTGRRVISREFFQRADSGKRVVPSGLAPGDLLELGAQGYKHRYAVVLCRAPLALSVLYLGDEGVLKKMGHAVLDLPEVQLAKAWAETLRVRTGQAKAPAPVAPAPAVTEPGLDGRLSAVERDAVRVLIQDGNATRRDLYMLARTILAKTACGAVGAQAAQTRLDEALSTPGDSDEVARFRLLEVDP